MREMFSTDHKEWNSTKTIFIFFGEHTQKNSIANRSMLTIIVSNRRSILAS